jgi:hypothetical protein
VGRGPAPEAAAGGHQLLGRRLHLERGHVGLHAVAELGVQVHHHLLEQVLPAVEVAVEARRGHAHLAGDRPQRQPAQPLLDEDAARGVQDLAGRRRTDAVAPAERPDRLDRCHV